tara:strand:+ start:3314 stop:4324 length:1011 start_codon:yes stop_codon:yes gene_type:complete
MIKKNLIHEFNNIFPDQIRDEFLFPLDEFLLYLEALSLNPLIFYNQWSEKNRESIANKYWINNPKLDWKWSLSFPLFSLFEKYLRNNKNYTIIGLSGLPGSGKSTLGNWINNLARELGLDIKVISLDDFYLPGDEMDISMKGNPWNVPRGYPGSHSIDLLNQCLDTFLNTGVFNCPTFDKSLRDGRGDRSGWYELKSKILILEGWFVGCEPISNLRQIDSLYDDKFNLGLTQSEKEFRFSIQESLINYSKIWEKFDKILHLKSSLFNNTILWKKQQESEMIKLKGSGLKDNRLNDFIRMIQASIPQQSLSTINSDTTILINRNRRISSLYSNTYIF